MDRRNFLKGTLVAAVGAAALSGGASSLVTPALAQVSANLKLRIRAGDSSLRPEDPQTPERFRAIVFDAYGTLLDVNAAMARHASRLGAGWPALAAEWRVKQLEYSWVGSLTEHSTRDDFAACTARALDYVLAQHRIGDAGLRADLLASYERLDPYPEVPTMLAALRTHGPRLAILSNGTPAMLAAACAAAGIASRLDAIISVEEAGIFKPAPQVYGLVEAHLGVPPADCLFVSGNPFDTQAALANGFAVLRVNRANDPDEYGLRTRLFAELPDLAPLPALLG